MRRGVQDIQDALLLKYGGEDDGDVVEGSKAGLQVFRVLLHGVHALFKEVPLVHHYHAALAVFLDYVEDVHVLSLHAKVGVYHEDAHIRVLNCAHGPHDGVELEVLGHLSPFTHAGGIHNHEFMAELVVIGGDGVSGGTGHRRDDVPLLPKKGVCEGTLSNVGAAHDGNVREVCMVVFGRIFLRKYTKDLVQKITGTGAVCGRNAPDLTQPKTVEVKGVVHLVAGIHLVHAKDYRLLAAPEDVGYLTVIVRNAGCGLAHEKDGIGLLYGYCHLTADGAFKDVV